MMAGPVERMRVGAAVRWRGRDGRVERGHLIGHERTTATVVREDGERLRIHPRSIARDHRPRLRTIVTELDLARARFEVGDEVSFAQADGSKRTGTVERLNRKRARVRCGEERWDVPYRQLELSGEARRKRNDERLLEVADEARRLMDRHGLEDWMFRFSAAETKLGECREPERIIQLSARHAATAERREVTDTILHEIAHALAGAKARRGPAWKAVATRLGSRPQARAEESADTRQRAEEARAKFRPGMAVSFRARRGQRLEGIIEKLNPKRVRVNCGGAVFLVPYLAMEAGGWVPPDDSRLRQPSLRRHRRGDNQGSRCGASHPRSYG